MQTLKIKLHAPSAHYRMPHSSNPHCTYPVPPYSTVIGILCNILGNKDKIQEFLAVDFGLGMLSRYESLTREYVWYRNLNQQQHKRRYNTVSNRRWQERPDHPGGQSPVSVEVLNEVELNIYLMHRMEFLKVITENLLYPERWFNHIHLGRSEDWAWPVRAQIINLEASREPAMSRNAGSYFQWIPRPEYCWDTTATHDYIEYYKSCKGTLTLVSNKYHYVLPSTGKLSSSSTGAIRNFTYIKAKMSAAPVSFLKPAVLPELYVDPAEHCPVHFARIEGEGENASC